MDPDDIIAMLNLAPHPEGGHFVETYRTAGPGRPAGSCIYYLLRAGERSRWHRIDADEIWHHYAGDPLLLELGEIPGNPEAEITLGPDIAGGARPQVLVPARRWQSARPLGRFALVGCTVSPGFEFAGFELAPSDPT